MCRNSSTLPPDGGIADPGAMKSWEAALLTHNKVADFSHPTSVFVHSTAPPSFPPPSKTSSLLPSVPHFSPPRSRAAWMTLRTLHVGARQEKLSSRCTTPHLIRGKIAV